MLSGSWTYRRVGDFEIKERIGRGGGASVYRARQIPINRYVALKIIDLAVEDDDSIFKRFEQEAQMIASLEHLHILPIYDYGFLEHQHAYFATRLMHRSLADELHGGALSLARVCQISTQIASALAHAHQQGVVHRDIKPSNILLDDMGNAFLGDFGLALTPTAAMPSTGLIGTPSYMAPELMLGKPADSLSDVYSFGVVIYHMLTGRAPFEISSGLNIASLLYKHAQQAPPPLRDFNPTVPPDVERVVLRALAKTPEERYPSVSAMSADLLAAARRAELSPDPPRSRRHLSLFARSFRRSRLPAGLIGGLLLLLLIGAGIVITEQQHEHMPQIMRGISGRRADITPTSAEISLAQTALGVQGYIAYFACNLAEQTNEANALRALAGELNVRLQIFDSANDAYLQVTQVERARIEGARAIVLCPIEESLTDTIADSLALSSIPLIFSRPFDHPYGIKLDYANYDIGLEIGRYAGRILQTEFGGRGSIVLLGFPGSTTLDERTHGMRDGIAQVAPNAVIVGEWRGVSRTAAQDSIRELVQQGVQFNAILTVDGSTTIGAVDALAEVGLSPAEVFVVGALSNTRVLAYVEEGYYVRGTLAFDDQASAQLILYAAIKALAGSSIPETLTYDTGALITR